MLFLESIVYVLMEEIKVLKDFLANERTSSTVTRGVTRLIVGDPNYCFSC